MALLVFCLRAAGEFGHLSTPCNSTFAVCTCRRGGRREEGGERMEEGRSREEVGEGGEGGGRWGEERCVRREGRRGKREKRGEGEGEN